MRSPSTGYPVTDLTPAERWLSAASLNPIWAEQQFTIQRELWRDSEKRMEAVGKFGEEYAWAVEKGDVRLAQDVVNRAQYQGVPLDKVLKSAKARLAKIQEPAVTRDQDKELLLEYLKAGVSLTR